MRLVPLITAAIVAAFLYGIVIERERLFALIEELSPNAAQTEDSTQTADTTAPAAVAAEPEAETGPVAVMAKHSVARQIGTAVLLRGETEAARQVNVLAETSGKVISEPLRKGAFVEAGQLLCELDPGTREATLAEAEARLAEANARRPETEARIPEAKARVAEARARLEEANINATAARKLIKEGFASKTRLANAEASVRAAEAAVVSAEAGLKAAQSGLESLEASIESAEAAVARARTEIDRLKITAPFAGLLESDAAELGSLLQPGALCATVIQLDPIKVVGFVPETEVAKIKLGARAGARLNGGGTVGGKVSFLSRSADPTTRTFRVELEVPNPGLAIRDGQTAEISIETAGQLAHLLPASTLTLDDDGSLGVRTIDADGVVKFMPVSVIRDARAGIYVTGLPDKVDVITVGQEYVIDGVVVAPSFEEVIQ